MNSEQQNITAEGYQIQMLMEQIGETAQAHAREVSSLKLRHALQLQDIHKLHAEELEKARSSEELPMPAPALEEEVS